MYVNLNIVTVDFSMFLCVVGYFPAPSGSVGQPGAGPSGPVGPPGQVGIPPGTRGQTVVCRIRLKVMK